MRFATSGPSLSTVLGFLYPLVVAGQDPSGSETAKDPAAATVNCERFKHTGFWDIDIDNGPALAPECGPPLALNANRNGHRLPVEIGALVASYVGFFLFIGLSAFTIRRRKQRRMLRREREREIEMVVADNKKFEPSPLSPAESQRSWMRNPLKKLAPSSIKSSIRGGNSNVTSPQASPTAYSHVRVSSSTSFDPTVVESARASRQAEMERLYAAVMAHDEARNSQSAIEQKQHGPLKITVPQSPASPTSAGPGSPRSPIRAIYPPPEFAGSNPGGMVPVTPVSPTSPHGQTSPTTTKTYLPNDMYPASPPPKPRHMSLSRPEYPLSPTSPKTYLPNDMYPASPPPKDRNMHFPSTAHAGRPPTSPRKFSGSSRPTSISSAGSKTRRVLRNMRINTSHGQTGDAEERTPLSATFRDRNGREPPTPPTAGTLDTTNSMPLDEFSENLDEPKPLPTANPHRKPSKLSLPGSNVKPGPSTAPLPSKSASSSTHALPLRAQFPDEGGPPAATKTTFLERRVDRIGRGMLTGRTPITGVPTTPYSPYMPFTPVTPVTPHLVTRKERKEREKAEKKERLEPLDEDIVKADEDMWE